jgi:CheY-like chemotaxis protein
VVDRQRLSEFADLLSEPAAFLSKAGAIEVANHPFSTRIARAPADCVGRQAHELFPEGTTLQRLVDESLESGRPVRSLLSVGRGEETERLLATAEPCPPSADSTEPLVLLRLFPPPSTDAGTSAKDALLSAVSHELRSPMNAIVTWAHLLRQGGLDEVAASRALEAIERNARLQARILDDLREMSRREDPRASLDGPTHRAFTDVGRSARTSLADASAIASSRDDGTDLSGIRVLIVDDDREARESITALLLENHAEASSAGSVREALRHLAETPPHVVLTDLLMPDLDGFALLRMIRTIEELNAIRIPTIALTALAGEESQRRGLDSGFDVYLMKPVAPAELLSIVSAAAHSQATNR